MVGKRKERPVATRRNQSRIRPPTTTSSFVYQTPIPVCLPASNNGVCGILLINNVSTSDVSFLPVYCGIVVPYSAAPMCQVADALRFGHVDACVPPVWYVPVYRLPYHGGIDPSERSHLAAYCLQHRCLLRPCVVFTNSASHPSERWHRGCLAKP